MALGEDDSDTLAGLCWAGEDGIVSSVAHGEGNLVGLELRRRGASLFGLELRRREEDVDDFSAVGIGSSFFAS